jgi:hypothetical protein
VGFLFFEIKETTSLKNRPPTRMTRGNQRELARLKNLKKDKATKSGETEANKGLTLEERKERDAERMRQKQKAALEKKDGPAQAADK